MKNFGNNKIALQLRNLYFVQNIVLSHLTTATRKIIKFRALAAVVVQLKKIPKICHTEKASF